MSSVREILGTRVTVSPQEGISQNNITEKMKYAVLIWIPFTVIKDYHVHFHILHSFTNIPFPGFAVVCREKSL